MDRVRPRLWPYNPASSPVALPEVDVLYTASEVVPLTAQTTSAPDDVFDLDALRSWAGTLQDDQGARLGDLLNAEGAAPLDQRRPFLLLGELPIRSARQPSSRGGTHPSCPVGKPVPDVDGQPRRAPHSARPSSRHLCPHPGWWEECPPWPPVTEGNEALHHVAVSGPAKATGAGFVSRKEVTSLEHAPLDPPAIEDVTWDGSVERVERGAPAPTGAGIDLASVMVPVHARRGCYDHRGRLARCVHLPQRAFHEGVFRRGSARDWSDVLDTLG